MLKLEVNAASKLELIREYLKTHKYKEFRDKANLLRQPFEQQLVWSNPNIIQSYSKGVLMKSNETRNGKTVQKTYMYDENGRLIEQTDAVVGDLGVADVVDREAARVGCAVVAHDLALVFGQRLAVALVDGVEVGEREDGFDLADLLLLDHVPEVVAQEEQAALRVVDDVVHALGWKSWRIGTMTAP